MYTKAALAFALAAAASAAAAAQSATVVIEASHGGAGNGLTNTTISVPLGTTDTDPALGVVSTLYLTGSSGAPLESITCTPYRYANATGAGGLPFTSSKPSYLSTNTVQVGSLVCVSNLTAPGSGGASGALPTTMATSSVPYGNSTSLPGTGIVSTVTDPTSTYLTTIPASSRTATQSTVTNVVTGGGNGGSGNGAATATTAGAGDASTSGTSTATPSVRANAAGKLQGAWEVAGAAVLGVGLLAAI